VAVHSLLGLRHISRIDLIVDDHGTPWFLEANVLPGLTETSLVPQSIEASGHSSAPSTKHLPRRHSNTTEVCDRIEWFHVKHRQSSTGGAERTSMMPHLLPGRVRRNAWKAAFRVVRIDPKVHHGKLTGPLCAGLRLNLPTVEYFPDSFRFQQRAGNHVQGFREVS
jgi:hypothetical protein